MSKKDKNDKRIQKTFREIFDMCFSLLVIENVALIIAFVILFFQFMALKDFFTDIYPTNWAIEIADNCYCNGWR